MDCLENEQDSSYLKDLYSRLDHFRLRQTLCDVTIAVDGRPFEGHRLILSAASPYFDAMFTDSSKEAYEDVIFLDAIDPDTFELFFDYFYTNEIIFTSANVRAVLSASEVLRMDAVKEGALKFLEDYPRSLSYFQAHDLAVFYNRPKINAEAKAYILKHFLHLSYTEEFLNLSTEAVIDLIKDDYLGISCEHELWDIVELWCQQKSGERDGVFPKLFDHIRLLLMSPHYLADVVACSDLVRNDPYCMSLVKKAKDYSSRHHLRVADDPRTKIRKSSFREAIVILSAHNFPINFLFYSAEGWIPLKRFTDSKDSQAVAVSDVNILYVVGGRSGKVRSASLWCYDPEFNDWEQLASMRVARSSHCIAMLNGYLYAVGGFDNDRTKLDSVERYDPKSNTWVDVAPAKMPVVAASLAALNGKLYLAGGDTNTGPTATVQCYDPATDSWTYVASMFFYSSDAAMCALGSNLYFVGGNGWVGPVRYVERYDSEKNVWENLPSLNSARVNPGITVLCGRIFVLGGGTCGMFEVYGPGWNCWKWAGPMPERSKARFACASMGIRRSFFPNSV